MNASRSSAVGGLDGGAGVIEVDNGDLAAQKGP